MKTIAEQVDTISKLINWLREYGYQIGFALPTFPDWNEKAGGLIELAKNFDNAQLFFVMRFSPSGRVRVAKTFEEAETLLFGMLTICSENNNKKPFISEHNGKIIIDD